MNAQAQCNRVGVTDDQAVALLEDIVSTPSPTGSERAVADRLVARMRDIGLEARRDEVGNAVGERQSSGGPTTDIVLLGHMDTFPGVVPVRREGEKLFGRGSVDAKGPLAAFAVAAARAALPSGVRVVIVGAIDEEGPDSIGARHAASCYSPAACIIGEPSHWDGVTIGYKGRVLVTFRAQRACAHSAGPGRSAPDAAAAWWAEVQHRLDARNAGRARVFDRIQHTLRSIHSDSDGLNEWCEAHAGFRIPPGVTPDEIVSLCRVCEAESRGSSGGAGIDALNDDEGNVVVRIDATGAEIPIVTDRNSAPVRALVTSIREVSGRRERIQVKTGTCDMNVVAPLWKCPIAAYGPGDSSLDHTPEEHILIPEFLKSVRVLTLAIEKLATEVRSTP